MPRLVLVLRDLYPSRLSEAARAALPRLEALERWLARGDIDGQAGDWRGWLRRELGGSALGAAPLASIAGAALDAVPAAQPLWLATPVHFVAGLDTVRLHPAGLLDLDPEEQQVLAADFARVFAGSGWSLLATGRRELLLAGGEAGGGAGGGAGGAVSSHDPALFLGADPGSGLPAGAGSAGLRRLGAELGMWLHEHPVNEARMRRGRLGANALWIWGGGAPAAAPGRADPARSAGGMVAWADDLFVDGLARLTGAQQRPRPDRFTAAAAAAPAGSDLLVVCGLGATPDARSLEALERDWLAPALAHWHSGACASATLLAGTHAVTLAGPPLRRRWRALARGLRRARPWWEILLQCQS